MHETARKVIANAERLYADAIRMRTLGSKRTASSLFILAMEEASKACLIRWIDLGYDRGKILEELANDHLQKQLVYLAYIYTKCLKEVGTLVPAKTAKEVAIKQKAEDIREALAKAIARRTPYYSGSLLTGLYDHVKQAGFYTDVKDDLSIAEPAYKDGSIVHHLEEDARDAIAMAREDNLTLAMTALIYFSQLSKPLPGKQGRANLASLIDILRNHNWDSS
jgi:AbiV family abortive infection protein